MIDDLNILPASPENIATFKGWTINAINIMAVNITAIWAIILSSFLTPLKRNNKINPKPNGIRAVNDPPAK